MSRQSSIPQVNSSDGSGMNYLTGVGYVPNGPRANRQSRNSTDDVRRSILADAVYIKQEEEEGEHMEGISDIEMENNMDMDYNSGYLNTFQGLLASYHSERSSSYRSASSQRQRVFGHQSRENSSNSSRSRRIQRHNTVQPRGGSDRRYTSGSPMFFPVAESDGRREDSTRTLSETSDQPHTSDTDEPGNRCTCPISYNCNHRPNILLDCRPLVLERLPWQERRDQEAFDR